MTEQVNRRTVLIGGVMSIAAGLCPRLEAMAKEQQPTRVRLQHAKMDYLEQQWMDAQGWQTVHGCE